MPQRNRRDCPGRSHHLMNRGVAKRVIFPDRQAKRRFLSLVACSVRRGELLVEAYSILDTHFHILAHSPEGRIDYSMMRIENAFARYFNRRYGRDGSPFKGRFNSTPIEDSPQWHNTITYIDANPVDAKLCHSPEAYAWGSARLYTSREEGPPWLHRTRIERYVMQGRSSGARFATLYPRAFRRDPGSGLNELVEARLRRTQTTITPADGLLKLPPRHIVRWMRERAHLADGLEPWTPIAGVSTVLHEVELAKEDTQIPALGRPFGRTKSWEVLRVGLIHALTGFAIAEIARTLNVARSTVAARLKLHRAALEAGGPYPQVVGNLTERILRATYGNVALDLGGHPDLP